MSNETNAPVASDIFETANDKLKRSFGTVFWSSMIAATAVHFAVMAFWPTLQASDMTFTMDEIVAIEIPPEIQIPPPPEAIARPANPVVSAAVIDDNVTISTTTFETNPMDDLPPPPTAAAVDVSSQPTFTPYEVAPEVRNRQDVQRALEREYPSILRDAGIGGQVIMHFFINDQGVTEQVLVAQSSGHQQLDDAAVRVAGVFQFTPALNRDQRVPVWIQIPITFTTR